MPTLQQQRTVRFDNRTAPAPPSLGYPSLLKQQLRDLVLRRKSLVREEPEDGADSMMEFTNSRAQIGGGGTEPMVATDDAQPKTGLFFDFLNFFKLKFFLIFIFFKIILIYFLIFLIFLLCKIYF